MNENKECIIKITGLRSKAYKRGIQKKYPLSTGMSLFSELTKTQQFRSIKIDLCKEYKYDGKAITFKEEIISKNWSI